MLDQLASGELFDRVRGLHWPARRLQRGAFQGSHRSTRIGPSPEFMQYREYRPGDEAALIDWKLYGRTERLAVRQTHDDSELRTVILVDASGSMAFPEPGNDKWRLAVALACGLAAVAQNDRDPVGLAVVGAAGAELLPPRARLSAVANILRVLSAIRPAGATPLAPTLAALRGHHRMAIISDFLGDAEALREVAAELIAAGREIHAIHIVAREELEPRGLGGLVVDPEAEEGVRRPLDEAGLAEYRRAFGEWREALAGAWRAAGAYYQLALTGEPADQLIRRIVTPAATAATATAS